jgi:hypothetical protein
VGELVAEDGASIISTSSNRATLTRWLPSTT